MKISAVILTYNEESRIRTALAHATKWADEVCVVDKGSTDRTREIAEEAGASIHVIPFSKQGHERQEDVHSAATNDWTWIFTPGEVPTRGVIEAARAIVSDSVDCVIVPHKLFSFGEHSLASPWSISGQPRLLRRANVEFTGIAHNPIRAKRMASITYSESCHVLHQTHATADTFIRVHADYALNEAANGTPEEAIKRAMGNFVGCDERFALDPSITSQMLGWKIYWLMVALHAAEKLRGRQIVDEYSRRAVEMLANEWNNQEP
jgi:hypothetical protein